MFEVFCCVQSVFIETIPSHPCFAALCLTLFFFSTPFSTFAFGSSTSLSLSKPVDESIHCQSAKDGYVLVDWLKNHTSQVMSPNLSSESAATHTFRYFIFEKRQSRHER